MTDELLEPALAASRNHREAERRRRERIKFHLDRLRSLLSCDARIDKASLLAKAVDHVRDLKKRAAEIGGAASFPTEADEVAVDPVDIPTAAGRRHILMASFCCDDRSGLLPELAETLKSLRLKILRAEIATVGGRVRNVLAVAGEDGGGDVAAAGGAPAAFLEESLRAMVDRGIPAERPKRRRVSGRRTTTV
ncbi:unnamed protein product [Spirodela intermedia]|nr:unnamed protein product [Spirodela intermedia]CAA6661960.1 unnamed protein product [Spirodela intermedia]